MVGWNRIPRDLPIEKFYRDCKSEPFTREPVTFNYKPSLNVKTSIQSNNKALEKFYLYKYPKISLIIIYNKTLTDQNETNNQVNAQKIDLFATNRKTTRN